MPNGDAPSWIETVAAAFGLGAAGAGAGWWGGRRRKEGPSDTDRIVESLDRLSTSINHFLEQNREEHRRTRQVIYDDHEKHKDRLERVQSDLRVLLVRNGGRGRPS